MNAAVLFDSAEEDTRLRHPKIHGQEIYLYALKTFYSHREIDCIFFLWRHEADMALAYKALEKWKRECGLDKPVVTLHGVRSITQLWLYILQSGQEKILQYVFYDVRYPMVTEGMISQAIQKAAEYEAALFGREEDRPDEMGETGILRNLRFYSYPAAVSAKSPVLHCLHEPRHILRNLLEYEPYICKTERHSFPVYDAEDMRRAESIISESAAVHKETR